MIVAAALCVALGGCASVTRGPTETISIASTPAGATADIAGLDIPTACVTPCAIQAKRNADIVVTISKDGYRPQIIPLTKDSGSGGAGFAGNLLLGGDVGMGVDAVLDHKPNPTPRPPRPPRRRERPVS
ncbi:translation initiation factor 2 [Bradyrhizobium tropiciagri]|uniref:PEGA domain-containing protein n=1 Tax=Bradyrhizobium tropiciagri TaxID=312253 RepID=UPI001BAD9702|nr:PEGA domain-containing protein [Bradyrhizobium tropiciagri]MBR0893668.1 translation initiation factor 2 [Bradyrhizobium tropiciagri]